MIVFVTGVGGQLGYDVMNELSEYRYDCVGSDILETADNNYPYVKLDITDKSAVEATLSEIKPDAVIHCAAWTAVDAAEDEENKPKVYAVNVTGTKNIAEACKKLDCKMIYISTDMCSTVTSRSRGGRTARILLRSTITGRQSMRASLRFRRRLKSSLS